MSLRQGSRSGGGWRRRLLFVVAAAVVLPGAVISQEAKPLPEAKKAEEHKRQIVVKATIVEAAAADIPAPFREIQRANVMVVTPEAKLAQEHQEKLNQRQTYSPPSLQPSVSGTTTLGFRSLAPKQLEASLAALVAQKDASVLCAPKLICNDGQRASLQTSGDDLVSLEVTPRVTKNGIELKYRFEVTQQQDDGGKTVRRSETRYEITNGKALVQTGCQTDGRELVLILEADELKMAPAAAIRGTGVLLDNRGVEAALADFDANMTGPISGWERVLRNGEAVPVRDQEPATFVIRALLFEAAPEAEFEFSTPRPTQTLKITRRVGDEEPAQLNSTAFSVPIESVPENIRRLQKSHEIRILSRPQIITLEGQPARVEVGQQVPPQNKDDDGFRGIKFTLTPTHVDGKTVLSGNLLMRDQADQIETTEYDFHKVELSEDLASLIRLKRGNSKPDLLLSLEAVRKPAVRNIGPVPAMMGKPKALVHATAVIAGLSADQEIDFDGHSPTTQNLAVSRVVGENAATTETATLYELPLGEPTELIQRMNEAGKLTIVARPKLMTMIDTEVAFVVGQKFPVKGTDGHSHGIRLSVNPSWAAPTTSGDEPQGKEPDPSSATDRILQADMKLQYRQLGQESLRFNFGKISPLARDKSQILVVKVSDNKQLLIAFHAQVMNNQTVGSAELSPMPPMPPPPGYRPPLSPSARSPIDGGIRVLGTSNSRASQSSGDSGSTGLIQGFYRQPMLAGSSKEFSRISTPVAPSPVAPSPVSTTVRVTIHGAVRNSGIYEVPAGPNNWWARLRWLVDCDRTMAT